MIVPGSANALLLARSAGYTVQNSLRFRASNSASLTFTPVSAGDRQKHKGSVFFKRGADIGVTDQWLFGANAATTGDGWRFLASNNALRFLLNDGTDGVVETTALFRDPTAHGHFYWEFDSTQATASNRLKAWWNGIPLTLTFTTNITLNYNSAISNTVAHFIGRRPASAANFYDGLISNFAFVGGNASGFASVAVGSFGQTDTTSGQWVPKAYGGAYGTNGVLLEFKDASAATAAAIGKDTSGNGNDWTPSGISVTSGVTFDQSTDTPTNNHAKFSPLYSTNAPTYQNANERIAWSGAASKGSFVAFDLTTGLYYAEATNTTAAAGIKIGVGSTPNDPSQIYNVAGEADTGETNLNGFSYNSSNGNVRRNATTLTTLASWNTNGDRIGIATRSNGTDLRIWLRKNGGAWLGTGSPDPITDTSPTVTITLNGPAYLFGSAANGGVLDMNTGTRAFVDTPPTGFVALNTNNYPSVAVTTSGTFTGNASADGPFIWTNGNPATLTINGNAVTFGTHADKTAGSFKLRTSSASYNVSGSNTWTATAGGRFVNTNKVPNNAQVNP